MAVNNGQLLIINGYLAVIKKSLITDTSDF